MDNRPMKTVIISFKYCQEVSDEDCCQWKFLAHTLLVVNSVP